jgi:predicted amidophosphoribosyltransferase
MLQRVRATRPQYGLSAAERRQNIAGAFALSVGISPDMVQGRRILLLDDIFTTGATLSACAKVLKQAGAGRVTALVLASDRN